MMGLLRPRDKEAVRYFVLNVPHFLEAFSSETLQIEFLLAKVKIRSGCT